MSNVLKYLGLRNFSKDSRLYIQDGGIRDSDFESNDFKIEVDISIPKAIVSFHTKTILIYYFTKFCFFFYKFYSVPAHDWWHKSEKLKFEFVRRVWTCTSGSVNTIEAVERYAKEWVKNEDLKCKKRIKVQKWRDQIAKEKEEERQKKELELKENVHDCKDCERKVKHLEKSKESKRKLAEWKEIKSMKEELEKADDLVKAVQELERNISKFLCF